MEPKPSLVPLMAKEAYISEMQGLSLRNITLSVFQGKKCIYQEFGEMMFTHAGVTDAGVDGECLYRQKAGVL